MVIISEDMKALGHIHPQDFDEQMEAGEAEVFFTFHAQAATSSQPTL